LDHWLDKAVELLTSSTMDLKELAEIAGEDPRTFYRGANLSGADLRGQDLTQFDLTGANLEGALIATGEFPIPEESHEPAKRRSFCLGQNLSRLLDLYCREHSYTYRAWAIKALLYRVVAAINSNRTSIDEIVDVTTSHPSLKVMVEATQGHYTRYGSQLDDHTYKLVLLIGNRIKGRRTGFTAAIIAGLVLSKMLELRNLPDDFDLAKAYKGFR
jgi:hypothetical protein